MPPVVKGELPLSGDVPAPSFPDSRLSARKLRGERPHGPDHRGALQHRV